AARRRRGRPAVLGDPRRAAGRGRAVPRRPRPSRRAARRRPRVPPRPPRPRPAALHGRVPDGGPVPPVPPVPGRGPGPHGRVHPGGGAMSPAPADVHLPIEGMTCASCVNRGERRLNGLDGVTATVNYATEKATVRFDPAAVAPEDLVAAVAGAGDRAALAARAD